MLATPAAAKPFCFEAVDKIRLFEKLAKDIAIKAGYSSDTKVVVFSMQDKKDYKVAWVYLSVKKPYKATRTTRTGKITTRGHQSCLVSN